MRAMLRLAAFAALVLVAMASDVAIATGASHEYLGRPGDVMSDKELNWYTQVYLPDFRLRSLRSTVQEEVAESETPGAGPGNEPLPPCMQKRPNSVNNWNCNAGGQTFIYSWTSTAGWKWQAPARVPVDVMEEVISSPVRYVPPEAHIRVMRTLATLESNKQQRMRRRYLWIPYSFIKTGENSYKTKFPGATELYFKNDERQGWMWAPPDGSFIPVDQLWVSENGRWKGQSPVDANLQIILQLDLFQKDKSHSVGHASDEAHEEHSKLEKAIHIIHEAHLALEVMEIIHHHVGGHAHAIEHVDKLLQEESYYTKSIEFAKSSMRAGKVRLAKFAQSVKTFTEARAANSQMYEGAMKVAKNYAKLADKIKGGARSLTAVTNEVKALAPFFQSGFSLIRASAVGKAVIATGKFAINPKFLGALIVVGACLEGWDATQKSTASTFSGRLVEGALVAGTSALIMSNPFIALFDLIAPPEYKVSTFFKGTAAALVGLGELLITGNSQQIDTVYKAMRNGEYGVLNQWAVKAGEYFSTHSFQDIENDFGRWIGSFFDGK